MARLCSTVHKTMLFLLLFSLAVNSFIYFYVLPSRLQFALNRCTRIHTFDLLVVLLDVPIKLNDQQTDLDAIDFFEV